LNSRLNRDAKIRPQEIHGIQKNGTVEKQDELPVLLNPETGATQFDISNLEMQQ
jgi:hypothetical protein